MIFDLISCAVALTISFRSTTVITDDIFNNTGGAIENVILT
jgi:hypothetical protein